jgi:hypothetical protein
MVGTALWEAEVCAGIESLTLEVLDSCEFQCAAFAILISRFAGLLMRIEWAFDALYGHEGNDKTCRLQSLIFRYTTRLHGKIDMLLSALRTQVVCMASLFPLYGSQFAWFTNSHSGLTPHEVIAWRDEDEWFWPHSDTNASLHVCLEPAFCLSQPYAMNMFDETRHALRLASRFERK